MNTDRECPERRFAVNGRRFIVAQLGARMHYAVPRILYQAGMLCHFFTDLCATEGWPRLLELIPKAIRPAPLTRILSRRPAGIPRTRITAFNSLGMAYARGRKTARTPNEIRRIVLRTNKEFCARVCRSDWKEATGVFTFNCAGLEILQQARRQGLRPVMEQTIAPYAVEQRLLREQRELYPGWEESPKAELLREYSEREQAEWSLAGRIFCGSEFVREGIRQCGGPMEKCVVVPYGVELPSAKRPAPSGVPAVRGQRPDEVPSINLQPSALNRPLRVLIVGAVGLRKGAPEVLAAARQLKGKAQFRWVGGSNMLPEATAAMGEQVQLTGPLPREQMAGHYQWADVFLLPSICEGSATVTYEALANGLPVICTPNSGSVVRNGIEGFVIPIRDPRAIADRIEQLAADAELRMRLGEHARLRVRGFTLEAYGQRLLAALGDGPRSE